MPISLIMLRYFLHRLVRCQVFVFALALGCIFLLSGAKSPSAGGQSSKKRAGKSATKAKKSGTKKRAVTVDPQAPAKDPPRLKGDRIVEGRPWYEAMFSDGVMRIAVFWGWDHPRETIEAAFPAFETLSGKTVYFHGQKARIEIGMFTSVSDRPKEMFQAALEDPAIDIVIYSGHARYGGGMAFSDRDDIFRSGNGEMIEDRHTRPFKYFRASAEDLEATTFPSSYRIVMLNCCDSEAHFRESWSRRFRDCGAPVDLLLVEYPVYNLYDHRRVLNLLQDLLQFADWKTIKAHYDSEVHKRKNRLVVEPVFVPPETEVAARQGEIAAD